MVGRVKLESYRASHTLPHPEGILCIHVLGFSCIHWGRDCMMVKALAEDVIYGTISMHT